MMKLEAPERDVLPASPAVLHLPPAALLVVAGVPGAGKTTLLSRVDASESLVLDPEPIRARYQRLLGRAPYRWWRPLVHAEHFLRVLLALPSPSGLIVHDTGTRGWRRRLLARLAASFDRPGHLLLLDVPARVALEGQQRRRRALRRSAFASHWHSWRELRTALATPAAAQVPGPGDPDPSGLRAEGWRSVRLLDRPAADRLRRVVIPRR
ncbi:MAG: AAA family ATPase [Actinomycetes bacterium]